MKTMKLDELMKHRGVLQVPLAKSLRVKQPSVSRWVRGESMPKPAMVLKIERALNAKCDMGAYSIGRLEFNTGR